MVDDGSGLRRIEMMRLAVAVVVSGAVVFSCAPETGDFAASYGPQGGLTSSPRTQEHALAVTGGTLQIVAGGRYVAAVDADRARVWVVEVQRLIVHATLDLPPGSAPGRMS